MKKSVAITTIVALHAAIIGTLLVQAGCSSEPQKPQAGTAKVSAEEIAEQTPAQETPVNNDISDMTPPEGSTVLRAAPTRPAWNMSGKQSAVNEVIVPAEEETSVVEPAVVAPKTQKAAEPKTTVAYTVKKGDNLTKIASKHGISTAALMSANGLNKSSVIRIGQELNIPGAPASAAVVQEKAPEAKSFSNAEETSVYIVKKGDSLSRIAGHTGMSVAQLMEVNGLKNHNIKIGQKLTVAKGAAGSATTTSATPKAAKTTAAAAPSAGEVAYTIKSGDTLGVIAKKHGTSISAISDRNGISDPRKIKIGQVIYIKSKSAGTTATAATAAPKAETPAVNATPAQPALKVDPVQTTTPAVETVPNSAPAVEELNVISEDIPIEEI